MAFYSQFKALLPATIQTHEDDHGLTLFPASTEQVANIVMLANRVEMPLALNAQKSDPPSAPGVFLDFAQLAQMKRHRQTEFLIHCETGLTIEALSQYLAPFQQRMALRYPNDQTLLTLLAEAPLSLTSTRYGFLHQWVVGIEAVTGDGQMVHYGGEVVKNVTGYDLNKLFIGSHHQFGLITSVILKLAPEPELSRSFLFHVEAFPEALALVNQLQYRLSSVEILTLFRTKTTFGWQVLVTLSGYRDIVQQESDVVQQAVSHLDSNLQELHLTPKALEQWVNRLSWWHELSAKGLVIRVSLPQKALLDLPYHFFNRPWLKSADVMMPMDTQQLFLQWISVNVPTLVELQTFQAEIVKMGGFIDVLRCAPQYPLCPELLNQNPQPVLQQWERRLKQAYDPNHILPARWQDAQDLSQAVHS